MTRSDDAGGSIKITPDRLREVSPEFRKASHETGEMISRLNQTTSSLVSDMYSAHLMKSPQALDDLWNKWRDALSKLANAMETVANNLDTAADGYQHADENAMPHRAQ